MKYSQIEKYRNHVILFIICVVQILISSYFASQKINFHVDEIATYSLANDENGGWIQVPHAQILPKETLQSFVSVAKGDGFAYADVWENQKNDVHPPFYYALIHTISSFFPEQFCVNAGIMINIVCSVAITILLYAIGRILWKDQYSALFLAAIWAISFGNMSQVVFLRMYLLTAVWIVGVLLLHFYYIYKKKDWKFYLLLITISVLGALTHYYYIMFLFFLALVFGINLLLKHQWKEAVTYAAALLTAGVTSILIFPAMLIHIFQGYRGAESFRNIFNLSDILGRLKWYFLTIDKQLFSGTLLILIAFLALLVVIVTIKSKSVRVFCKMLFREGQITEEGILLFVSLGYYFVVSKSTTMLFDRYIMPIYPALFVLLISMIHYGTQLFVRFKPFLGYILILGLSIVGLFTQKMEYLYTDSLPEIEYAQQNASIPVIVVCQYDLRMNAVYSELMNYNNLIVITPEEIKLLKENSLNYYDKLIVYELVSDVEISNNLYKEVDLQAIISMNTALSTYHKQYEEYKASDYITVTAYELE